MSLEETAQRLSITVEQVRGLIDAGALKAVDHGGEPRVTQESLLIYMATRLSAELKGFGQRQKRSVAADVLAAMVVPVGLVLWALAVMVEVFSLADRRPIFGPLWFVPAAAAVLGLLWWAAAKQGDFSSTKGVGTTLYGKKKSPEGNVGTMWLIFAGIPLLPIRSYVILEDSPVKIEGLARTQKFLLRPLGKVYWPQALPILVGVWAALAGLVAVTVLRGR